MARAGWRNKLSAPKEAQQQQSEERDRLLGYEAVAVKKHQQTFSAKKLVDTRKDLIAHVKEIAASGKGEWIIAMERSFVANDLERYAKADDKEMTSSLNAALQGFAAIERKHRIVGAIPAGQRRIQLSQESQAGPAPGRGPPGVRQSPRAPRQLCQVPPGRD